jgi:hypothetical protein
MDFNIFEGRLVSVLMIGRFDEAETYVGNLRNLDEWVVITPLDPAKNIEAFYIRKDQILSIWLYKEKGK